MVTTNTTPGTDWTQLSPQQKREWRLNNFLNAPAVKFVSRQAAENYRKRAQRLVKVFNLEEPDQVPVSPPVASLPFLVYNADYYSAMYDFELTSRIFKRFNDEHAEEFETLPARSGSFREKLMIFWTISPMPIPVTGFPGPPPVFNLLKMNI
jgi:hypothetical protein